MLHNGTFKDLLKHKPTVTLKTDIKNLEKQIKAKVLFMVNVTYKRLFFCLNNGNETPKINL